MKIITGPRGSGKTWKLFAHAVLTEGDRYFISNDTQIVRKINDRYKRDPNIGIRALTHGQFIERSVLMGLNNNTTFFIDNVDLLLQSMVGFHKVPVVTLRQEGG